VKGPFSGVAEVLAADTDDLRQLAIIAGLDPATMYIGTVMDGCDVRGQDLRGMQFTHLDRSKVLWDEHTRWPNDPADAAEQVP
jgi:hypothetical protein